MNALAASSSTNARSVVNFPTFHTDRGEVIVESVYISGPMTGHENFNFAAFTEAAEALRAMGFRVFSPHEIDIEEGDVTDADVKRRALLPDKYFTVLGRDMELIGSGQVDAGVFLDGWQASRGSRAEYRWLTDLALPTLRFPSLEWLEYRPAGRAQKA